MKGFALSFGLAVLVCLPVSALAQTTYTFQTINYPGDTFTQLLGINNAGKIAGYHGSGATGHPNNGFTLTLPNTFTSQNFPGSAQTQVISINNFGQTAGFYIDTAGNNHGFLKVGGTFRTVDFPDTTSTSPAINQLLGLNDPLRFAGYYADAAGNDHAYIYFYFGAAFEVLTIPGAVSAQATGITDPPPPATVGTGQVSGFYIDAAGITHGFWLNLGYFTTLDFPGATSTAAFGLNKVGQVVGTYTDSAGLIHGFIWTNGTGFQGPVDDPNGLGATIINGINDKGVIVGFYGSCASGGTTCDGFVGTP